MSFSWVIFLFFGCVCLLVKQVSEFSSKEYGVEQNLDKMQSAWTGVKFEYSVWHATGTSVIRAVDDIQQMLEEHLVKTQSLATSPYIGPFEDRVKLWLEKLNLVQEVWKIKRLNGFHGYDIYTSAIYIYIYTIVSCPLRFSFFQEDFIHSILYVSHQKHLLSERFDQNKSSAKTLHPEFFRPIVIRLLDLGMHAGT
jgi:hypothetical protein